MLIFVLIAESISVLLGLLPELLDISATFAVHPFLPSSVCVCFTKLMRPLLWRWRFMGHNNYINLDDGLSSQPDGLSWSDLLCNEEKSMQIGECLGFVIDSISLSFWIPEKKVSKLKGLLESAIQARCSSFRDLARIAGQVLSFQLLCQSTQFLVFWPGRWTLPLKPSQHGKTSFQSARAHILVLQHRLVQRLFYKATISDPYRFVFRFKWYSFRRFFIHSRRHRYERHVETRG